MYRSFKVELARHLIRFQTVEHAYAGKRLTSLASTKAKLSAIRSTSDSAVAAATIRLRKSEAFCTSVYNTAWATKLQWE